MNLETNEYSDLVKVTVERGWDGAPVVYIDTNSDLDGTEGSVGPSIRVRLNDDLIYGGTDYYKALNELAGKADTRDQKFLIEFLQANIDSIVEKYAEDNN